MVIIAIGMSVPTVMAEPVSIGLPSSRVPTPQENAVMEAPNRVVRGAGKVNHACLSECNPDLFLEGSKHLCSPHTGVSGICELHHF